jgi:hypothetical protein
MLTSVSCRHVSPPASMTSPGAPHAAKSLRAPSIGQVP